VGSEQVLENYSWELESPGKVLNFFVSKRVGTLDIVWYLYDVDKFSTLRLERKCSNCSNLYSVSKWNPNKTLFFILRHQMWEVLTLMDTFCVFVNVQTCTQMPSTWFKALYCNTERPMQSISIWAVNTKHYHWTMGCAI